jgi:hypothetical protein
MDRYLFFEDEGEVRDLLESPYRPSAAS